MTPSPNIRHPKSRGEWVELQFMARAAAKGFTVSKPWGDSARYDFVTERRGIFRRVQVKSTIYYVGHRPECSRRAYLCGTNSRDKQGKLREYKPRDVDFFACFVIPLDLWYIVPVREMRRARFAGLLDPGHPGNRYFRFLEAWHLLQ